jgi:hypothetical protein
MRLSFYGLCMLFIFCSAGAQDLKLPVLSPSSSISQEISTSKIEINYSRPSLRGRKMFGDVVPYGMVWRTGANSATKITFGEDVSIGGTSVKAGSYSLYTIPGEQEWEIIINKNTGNWGANGYDTKDDVVRTKVRSSVLQTPVETFTITIGSIGFSSCTIDLSWERTHVSIPVGIQNQERLLTSIDKAINNPTIPYQPAATYLYETNQQLDKALEYATKAAEKNPKAYWIQLLRARIAVKLGKADLAREAAAKTIELAKGTSAEAEYTKSATDLLRTLK